MWTRMKQHLKENGLDPRDALHICGAAHSASDVPEFGTDDFDTWDIPPRTGTPWLYGLLPSSHAAIDHHRLLVVAVERVLARIGLAPDLGLSGQGLDRLSHLAPRGMKERQG